MLPGADKPIANDKDGAVSVELDGAEMGGM